jgi:hypothetical protein
MSPNSPFFPDYEGKSGERQINRHLKKLPPFEVGGISQDWKLDKLPEFGMADYCKNEIRSGKTQNQALQNTAGQYRVTQRTVTDNLVTFKSVGLKKNLEKNHGLLHSLYGHI